MISGHTRIAAVIGAPIAHSLSPVILNAAFAATGLDWAFLAFEVADGDAAPALDGMRALGIRGLSVTMPHKEAVAGLVDRCSADAAALGAVNCVVRDGDDLVGESTDGAGFIDAIAAETGFAFKGRRVVVLGAGGAARAVVLSAARAGAADIAVVNRTEAKAARAAALAGAVGRVASFDDVPAADLVVNATPIGMLDDGLPCDAGLLHAGQVVADLIYHPAATPLLAAARERGATAVNGLAMLVHQAGHSFKRWTGVDPPLAAMESGARAALTETR
ncbi:MAG: shikimate dehydrogenase [Acidimicrobiaceae bacterium]